MPPIILRDHEATTKVLTAVLDTPGGRRSLSRLARTCKTLSELSLSVLWQELDSLNPLIGLFPAHLFKKARKPGLGLIKTPAEEDWEKVLLYGKRVRRITYDERLNNVATTIFPIFKENRPAPYILPQLQQLVWKAETPAGLDRAAMFVNPELQALSLEITGLTKFPQLSAFLTDVASHTHLSSFAFISAIALPDAFTDILHSQTNIQKVVLVAPGSLAPKVGMWAASLPQLQTLQLDLLGRSGIAVEGFFDDIRSASGAETPDSAGSTDSGVFSGEEMDFSEIRKSSLKLTGDLTPIASFSELRDLHLTGETSNITVFLRHIAGNLVKLDLVIEDSPSKIDWRDLSTVICEKFGRSLRSLRVSATNASRFFDLVRLTPRAESASRHLSLEHLTGLDSLVRLEIDLPQSVIIYASDIAQLAAACPNVEILKLCPLAQFPVSLGSPKLCLADLAPLMSGCRQLHTLHVVVNARGRSEHLTSKKESSRSLLRLHVGHSWVTEPLQVAILLSHFAPHLNYLKWFQEKGRPGVIEANARGWQTVSEFLPHLQSIRLVERTPEDVSVPVAKVDQSIDATLSTVDRGISAKPSTKNISVQFSRALVDRPVQAKPRLSSASVDARPTVVEAGIHAFPAVTSQEVDASPSTALVAVSVSTDPTEFNEKGKITTHSRYYMISSISALFAFLRLLFSYPLFTRSRTIDLPSTDEAMVEPSEKSIAEKPLAAVSDVSFAASDNIPLENEREHVSDVGVISRDKPRELERLQTSIYNAATRQSEGNWPWSIFTSSQLTMAEQKKQEKDFTVEVDAIIPVTTSLAQSGKLQEALDQLFALEKHTRNASDLSSTTRLVKAAVELCYEARSYDLLNSSITLLSKKHGQLKGAVQAIVELAMSWLEDTKKNDGIERWLELVETLRSVTEGKIFLETPRARLTLLLSHYHESLANASPPSPTTKDALQTASDLLQDLQVETYSSMERREKTEFILEQMRLLIAVARQKDAALGKDGKDSLGGGEGEWVKVRVCGRKINEAFLKEADNEDLKLKFYDLMIQYALNRTEYLDVAKYYHKVWETPSIQEDKNGKGKIALEHIVYYVILSPHSNEQSDMLHRLFNDPALTKLELQYNLVKSFIARELMRWPGIETIYGPFLRQTPVFTADNRWEDLHMRVIEHNIRVVAEYYTRITLLRLTALLDLTVQQTEETLARLVVSGTIWARIDRPAGIVSFRNRRTAEDVMNDWSSDMQKLLGLVEKTWMGMNAAQAAQSRVKA